MPASETTPPLVPTTLVLGGARSGKSAFAESLLAAAAQPVYLATAAPIDAEMDARIARHRARRDRRWRTVEASIDLPAALTAASAADVPVLVDCITVWLGNLMHSGRDLDADLGALLESLAAAPGPVVLVASEVGQGIVPDNALARVFRDRAGELNQALARHADRVYFTVAGIATPIKGGPAAGA